MFLGIDLGTSGIKLIIIDEKGEIAGETRESYPSYGALENHWEQKPEDWIDALLKAAKALRSKTSEKIWGEILSIGLSAQMPTMVILGEGGQAIGNAIVWCDNRAEGIGKKLIDLWGESRHFLKSGVRLDGRYIAPMYLWVRENMPAVLPEKHFVLSAKDYIFYKLCKEIVTDPSTASGYGLYNINSGAWDEELCKEADISLGVLPIIADSTSGEFYLKKDIGELLGFKNRIRVVQGTADSVAGVLGTGAVNEGDVCAICGTSTTIIGVSPENRLRAENKFFITPLSRTGTFGMEADILSTGNTGKWLAEKFGVTVEELSELAAKAPLGSDGVRFYPYLAGGEQSVLWDGSLTGQIAGLNIRHGREHIARAYYEGICYEIKRCIDAFRNENFNVKEVYVSGPVSKDEFYMQLVTDILGYHCVASCVDNASAYGAAMMAAIGVGSMDWDFTKHESLKRDKLYLPRPKINEAYEELYKKYISLGPGGRFVF